GRVRIAAVGSELALIDVHALSGVIEFEARLALAHVRARRVHAAARGRIAVVHAIRALVDVLAAGHRIALETGPARAHARTRGTAAHRVLTAVERATFGVRHAVLAVTDRLCVATRAARFAGVIEGAVAAATRIAERRVGQVDGAGVRGL